MLSTWWSNTSHVVPKDDSRSQPKGITSDSNFSRRSTTFRHQSLDKETRTTSTKKKKSKHKRSKSKQQLQPTESATSRKVSSKSKSSVKGSETSSVGASESCTTATPRKIAGREQCKVINLKIPLPASDLQFRHSHYYKLQEEQEQYKPVMKGDESCPGTPKSRKKTCGPSNPTVEGDTSQHSQDKETTTLKSIELVSFVTSDLPAATDHYSEHQRILPKSKSLAAPAPTLSNKYSSLFTSLIQQRPDSATNWKETPSSSLNHFSPPTHRKAHPSLDYPDLALTSRRLSVLGNGSLVPTQHSMQDYIFRPVFRYYHQRNGNHQTFPGKSCSCTNGCKMCLASVRLSHPNSLLLDFQHPHLHWKSRRNSLDGGRSQFGSSCIELPPLSSTTSDEREESERGLHAQGRSVVRHFPRQAYRRPLKLSLCSASMYARSAPVPSYPDALTNGPPGFHRRLSQMAVLVSETVRWENEKPKTKSKKKSSSSNSGSQGSL